MAALFSVWVLASAVAPAQPPVADIEVTPSSLLFDSVCVGKSASKTVTIKNNDPSDGNGNDLTVNDIDRAQGSSSFAFTDPSPFTLAPQETQGFTVTFNSSLPPGNKNATFEIHSDGDQNPVSVPASATVLHRLIAVDSSTVAFGEQRVGTRSPSKSLIVRNPGQDAIQVTAVKRTGANGAEFIVAAPAVPFTIAAGDIRTITVAFQPTAEGLRKGTLEITSNSCTQPKLNVALVGTGVLPNLNVQPNPIDVGTSAVGTPGKPTSLTVSNDGQASLKITAIQLIGADAADFALSGLPVFPKTIQPEESFVFSIRMTPTLEGLRLANVNVLSDDPDAPTFTVPVRGTATAASPSPSASASASASASPSGSSSPGTGSPGPPGNSNDSLAIMLVVGGVLSAFVGLMVVRRFVRTPDDE